ncbi:MAG: hypothetical protein JNM56_03020, partial [Planctomycetia bacterium]|nr:hypothetical protein [Planctomycetia bacterium]
MLRAPRLFRYALLSLCFFLAPRLFAEQPVEVKKVPATKFIRVQRDGNKEPTALDTSIVRYVPAQGDGKLVVDLIGVVHVGERDYYEKLNKHFEQYDVLLYELVAPQGTRVPKGGKRNSDNPLSMVQGMMQSMLGLESQLEHIDYTKKNFVHADLSPDEMKEAMKARGENVLTVTLGVITDMLKQQNLQENKKDQNPHQNDLDPLALLVDPDASTKLKKMMALQMEDLESGTSGLGQTLNTILIADRNKAAMKVFQKELAAGKKKVGIFYGAAHMPDFEKRLRDDFGLKRDSEQWLTAWDMTKKNNRGNPLED